MSHICEQVVESARYLQDVGMSQKQLSAAHHFSVKGRAIAYGAVYGYFGKSRNFRANNSEFAERMRYVANERRRGRRNLDELIEEARRQWPIGPRPIRVNPHSFVGKYA